MTVEQKDVMGALVGAAGGTAGFGLAFVAAVAALHGLSTNPEKPRLNRLLKIAVVAFVVAIGSVGVGFLWFIAAVAVPSWGPALTVLYMVAIASFLLSIGALIYVLIEVVWLLRKADLIQLAAQAAATLKAFFS